MRARAPSSPDFITVGRDCVSCRVSSGQLKRFGKKNFNRINRIKRAEINPIDFIYERNEYTKNQGRSEGMGRRDHFAPRLIFDKTYGPPPH